MSCGVGGCVATESAASASSVSNDRLAGLNQFTIGEMSLSAVEAVDIWEFLLFGVQSGFLLVVL